MKKIMAIIFVIAVLLTNMLSLTGCSATTADTALSMGQWVTLIADSFGLQNFIEEAPHFSKVSANDSTYSAFQAAAEWGIIEPSNEIDSSTPVTWNDVLISLVNAGEFVDAEATDEEKIDFAIENFDPTIRKYWGTRLIKMKEAVPLLDTAQEMWANKTYSEKVEKTTFSEDVLNYIDNSDIQYSVNGEVVTTSSDELSDLKVGDVYTLPANESNSASINKVKTIENVDGKIVITNDGDFTEDEAAEYIQEIKIQETSAPDFSQISGIYDENGNPINFEIDNSVSAEGTSAGNSDLKASALSCLAQEGQAGVSPLGFFDNVKGSLKFTVGKWSVTIATTKNNLSVKIAKEVSKSTNRYREQKSEAYLQATFNNVKLTRDVDYSWGKLHSATVKLDYNTTVSGGIKTERSGKIGNPVEDDEETTKSLSSVLNQYKSTLQDMKRAVNNSKCDEDIYICKLALIDGGLASVDFILKGKVTASGDIKIVVEVEGSQGVQVKNGKFRYIKTKDADVDFAAEGSLEVTVAPGVAIRILKKIYLIEFTIDCGLGASVGLKAHLFDIEGHELYSEDAQLTAEDAEELSNEKMYTTPEEIAKFAKEQGGNWDPEKKGITGNITIYKGICLEWKLYPIVRFGISGSSLVGKIAKSFKVNLSVELLGSKNTLLQGHIDFPNNLVNMIKSDSIAGGLAAFLGVGAECTYNYTPWDEAEEILDEIDPGSDSSAIVTSDRIVLSTIRVTLEEGKTAEISITGLPAGYELKDLEAASEDPDIATFDLVKGITGIKEGVTQIVVKTKDGKFTTPCAVTVTTDKKVDFNPLPNKGGVSVGL